MPRHNPGPVLSIRFEVNPTPASALPCFGNGKFGVSRGRFKAPGVCFDLRPHCSLYLQGNGLLPVRPSSLGTRMTAHSELERQGDIHTRYLRISFPSYCLQSRFDHSLGSSVRAKQTRCHPTRANNSQSIWCAAAPPTHTMAVLIRRQERANRV